MPYPRNLKPLDQVTLSKPQGPQVWVCTLPKCGHEIRIPAGPRARSKLQVARSSHLKHRHIDKERASVPILGHPSPHTSNQSTQVSCKLFTPTTEVSLVPQPQSFGRCAMSGINGALRCVCVKIQLRNIFSTGMCTRLSLSCRCWSHRAQYFHLHHPAWFSLHGGDAAES